MSEFAHGSWGPAQTPALLAANTLPFASKHIVVTHARTSGNTSASAAHVYARRCDPGTEGAFSDLEMARRKFGNVRLAPDGKL